MGLVFYSCVSELNSPSVSPPSALINEKTTQTVCCIKKGLQKL